MHLVILRWYRVYMIPKFPKNGYQDMSLFQFSFTRGEGGLKSVFFSFFFLSFFPHKRSLSKSGVWCGKQQLQYGIKSIVS